MKSTLILDWSYPYRFFVLDMLQSQQTNLYVVSPEYDQDFELFSGYLVLPTLYEKGSITNNLKLILNFIKDNNIDFIFNTEDELVILENELKKALSLPNSLDIVQKLQNKHMVREIVKDNPYINSPKYMAFNLDDSSRQNQLDNFKIPFIIKPIDSNFSTGVSLVNEYSDISLAIDTLKKEIEGEPASKNKAMIEEVIPLHDLVISVEAFVQDGSLKAIMYTNEYQYPYARDNGMQTFFYNQILTPSDCNDVEKKQIKRSVLEIIKLFKIENLTLHVEFKKKDNKWYLIEINPRLGGGPIAYSHFQSSGVNLVLLSFKISNNLPISTDEITPTQKFKNQIQFINPKTKGGTVKSIGINVTPEFNYINKMIFFKKIGDVFMPSPTGIGFFSIRDKNMRYLRQRSNSVVHNIRIDIYE